MLSAPAAAQEPAATVTAEAETLVAAPDLAAAREAIDALLARADFAVPLASPIQTPEAAPVIEPDTVPAVLSSEVPAVEPEVVRGAPAPWLGELDMPALDVRWDDRLVSLLQTFRDDERKRGELRGLLSRAGRYEAMIQRTMREEGLPEELLFVAMAESGYDPVVVSPAGAVGLWQFTAATGKDYGLTQDRWVDERRSPERSTQAAAAFFKDLYRQLGSWPLSLAAYNMGYGALTRSLEKYNTNDFWTLARLEAGLPYETIAYVTKIMAYAIVARNLDHFGLGDLQREPAWQVEAVKVPGGTGLGRIAQAAGISVDQLAELNPELQRRRLPPDEREWAVRVPLDKLERFRDKWKGVQASAASHGTHVLRFGESLRDVAALYDTSVTKLRRLNDLSDDADVRPGARLVVPDVAPMPPEADDEPTIVGVPARTFEYTDRRQIFYRVAAGDTLSEIAKFFQVSRDEVARWNEVVPDAKLPDGLVLQLFVPRDADLSRAIVMTPDEVRVLVIGSEEFFDYHEQQRGRERIRYRIKAGDTLEGLSKRFGLSVGSIARINRFSRYRDPEVGSEVILYVPADKK